MKNTEQSIFKIAYLGSTPDTLRSLKNYDLFEVHQFDTSTEAVNKLRINKDFNAVLCETHLPVYDGIQTRNLMLKANVLNGIPFILISHQDEPEMFKRAFDEKIDDYYTAPISAERIYNRLKFIKSPINKLPPSIDISSPIVEYKTPTIKRLFDIIVAGTALLLLSPLMLVVIIAIKLESKGPCYYVSKRVGANFRTFGLLKFRSMRVDADKLISKDDLAKLNQYGNETIEVCPKCAKLPPGKYCSEIIFDGKEPVCEYLIKLRKDAKPIFVKIENDPRITKVGKFIRNTRIDELPQLINIIKGDMSIVGNWPLHEYEASMLSTEKYLKRFFAPAGLTGLWQVELRGRKDLISEEERLALDVEYAENNSFWGDIKIIIKRFKSSHK